MNNLVNTQTTLTMSSREIAKLCDKRHDNIVRDIRQICTDLKIEVSKFQGNYKDSTGRKLVCYNLPKRECLILVSGYSTVLRSKIIDRWIELEGQSALQLGHDFDDFNYLRQYVLTNYPKIMGIIFGRLLKIDEIEKELDHYKSVTKEAKRVLASPVVKAA
ncbi:MULTISPECIES: Rha family transcriptional regulator [unclassified Bartonella]|uniref:Rha family transcriptional regulator n=1 Tax=unclassified Bartonella TaxID=2645622 RepID=UPI0035CEF2C3